MARVFNLGLGMVLAVRPGDVVAALAALEPFGHQARVVGHVVAAARGVTYA